MTDIKTIAAECATRIMDRMEMCRGSAILKGDIEREVEIALAQYDPFIRQSAEVDWGPDVGQELFGEAGTVAIDFGGGPVAVNLRTKLATECKPGVLELHYEDAAGSHIFSSYADLDAYIAQRDGPYPKTTFEDWHAYGEAKRRGEVLPTPGGYPDLSDQTAYERWMTDAYSLRLDKTAAKERFREACRRAADQCNKIARRMKANEGEGG